MTTIFARLQSTIASLGRFALPFSIAAHNALSIDEREVLRGSYLRAARRYRRIVAEDIIFALRADHIDALMREALACYQRSDHNALAVLIELALLRPEVLAPYYPDFIDSGTGDNEGILYYAAGAAISTRLLNMVRTESDTLSPNRLLCILAWIGDANVVRMWEQWRQEGYRPQGLFLDPYQYALNAGWELRDGQRRTVILPSAYELIPSRDVTNGQTFGPVMTTQPFEETCQWCQRPLLTLFDLDLRDPRMFHLLGRSGERLRIVCCAACTPYEAIFIDIDLQGKASWSTQNPEHGGVPPDEPGFQFPPHSLVLGTRFHASVQVFRKTLRDEGMSHLGGYPIWVQDFSEHPICPQCAKHMLFIGQADVADMMDSEGIFYAFVCFDCGLSTCVYQQT